MPAGDWTSPIGTQRANEAAAGAQALGIALKLTLQGQNQFWLAETYYCILVRLEPGLDPLGGHPVAGPVLTAPEPDHIRPGSHEGRALSACAPLHHVQQSSAKRPESAVALAAPAHHRHERARSRQSYHISTEDSKETGGAPHGPRCVTAAPRGADRRGVRADADQLPEQGAGRVQHVHRVAHLLRHVHRRDHHRLLHHVPGAPRLFNT